MGRRITVLGWYGHGNVGDESYKISFADLFPGDDLYFTDKVDDRARNCDAAILGGGNVLSPYYLDEILKLNVPRYAFSISVSLGLESIDRVAGVFDKVFVRDYESIRHLADRSVEAHYLPDFAFTLRPDKRRGATLVRGIFEQAQADRYNKVVAVVMNSNVLVRNDLLARDWSTFDSVAWQLSGLADATNASFLFLPFGTRAPHDDRIANSFVAGRCKWYKKNAVVYDRLSVQDTLDVLSAVDCTISSRLHSTIFSCVGGTPFIDLTHHSKNEWFLKSIGRQDCAVSYWQFSRPRVAELLNSFIASPETPAADLLGISERFRTLLTGVANNVRLI